MSKINISTSRVQHFEFKGVDIHTLTINPTVKIIGRSAFASTNLKAVTFMNDSSLEKIFAFAFHECTRLETITFPETITRIGNNAFEGCTSLKLVKIPKSVKSIGNKAFKDISKDAVIEYY